MSDIAEGEVLQIARTDRKRSFEIAFGRYWEQLYLHAFRKVQSEEVAKDLVQEVFIVLWDNLDELPADSRLAAYLYAVLRNKILKLFEKDEVRLRHALHISGRAEETAPTPQHLLQERELQDIVNREVAGMPSRMQAIYLLRKSDELSIGEIANQLNLSPQTIKNQLQNAVQRLRRRLRDYG